MGFGLRVRVKVRVKVRGRGSVRVSYGVRVSLQRGGDSACRGRVCKG